MPKIYATIPEKTLEELKNISQKSNRSFSNIVHEIIELGLAVYKNDRDIESPKLQSNPITDADSKHKEYLLRILNISSEILRRIYNESSKCSGKTANSILAEIKTHVQKRLDKDSIPKNNHK